MERAEQNACDIWHGKTEMAGRPASRPVFVMDVHAAHGEVPLSTARAVHCMCSEGASMARIRDKHDPTAFTSAETGKFAAL